jgi:hypothetical protein
LNRGEAFFVQACKKSFAPVVFLFNASSGEESNCHYEGWEHFREPHIEIEKRFATAGLGEKLRWVPLGKSVELDI